MKKITNSELINFLIQNKNTYFEVSLNNGFFNATHFLRFGGKKIYDTGIDSKECIWEKEEFLNLYTHANWIIDQIIKPI